MTNGIEALRALLDGSIIEGNERYYRMNNVKEKIEYSDDMREWQDSNISVNAFLLYKNWNIVRK